MGWMTGWPTRQDLIKHLLDPAETPNAKRITHCFRGNNLWVVYEGLESKYRFIALYLMRGWKSDRPYQARDWGYKDLDETVGPRCDCPLSYLTIAQPTDPRFDTSKWRAEVAAWHALRTGIKLGDKLKVGGDREYKVIRTKPLTAIRIEDGTQWRIPKRLITARTSP